MSCRKARFSARVAEAFAEVAHDHGLRMLVVFLELREIALDLVVHQQRDSSKAVLDAMAHRQRSGRDQLVRRHRETELAQLLERRRSRARGRVGHEAKSEPGVAQALDRLARARERACPPRRGPRRGRAGRLADAREWPIGGPPATWLRGFPRMAEREPVITFGWCADDPTDDPAARAGRRTTTATTTGTRRAGAWIQARAAAASRRVDPAAPRFPALSPRWILFVVARLGLNIWLVSYLPDPPQRRVRIPYNPTFLQQVRDGNVKSISSKGETVQGELRRQPALSPRRQGRGSGHPDRHRGAHVRQRRGAGEPARAQRRDRERRSRPRRNGRLIGTILLSFAPTLLLVGPVHLHDPAHVGRCGRRRGLRAVAGAACGVERTAAHLRRRGGHRRGQGRARRRSSTSSSSRTSTAASAAGSRGACC